MNIKYDLWSGVYDKGGNIETPSWEIVHNLLLSLDGQIKTLISLKKDGVDFMVGGGPELYVCIVIFNDDNIYNLSSNNGSLQKVFEMKIGGQYGEYASNHVVDISMALSSLKYFFDTGKLSPEYQWIKE